MKPTHAMRIATLTSSDTRTPESDEGGQLLGDLFRAAGFVVVSHAVVREEPELLRAAISELTGAADVDAIVTTGGTGIAPRDRTIETIVPLFERTIDGFGEAFRRLSWDEVGPYAILSRATAGVIQGKFVAALPGSVKGVRLAVEQLILPTLEHVVALLASRPEGADHTPRGAHKKTSNL